jgi:ubiquinone/menaquinone biosynthesis C-methylase UbiE
VTHQSSTWDTHADWWRDTFTGGADDEYEQQMLPLIAKHLGNAERVLDLGTGEGQVARRATGFVVGVDSAMAQLRNAQNDHVHYLQADIARLPIAESSFDAVTMCLVLEHVDDIEPVLAEVARVLVPGGKFLLFLNHPAFQTPDSGWVDDQIMDEQYWRSGPYLTEITTEEQIDADVTVPFSHRTLSTYLNAASRAGLILRYMEEPAPFEQPEYPGASAIPRLLFAVFESNGA